MSREGPASPYDPNNAAMVQYLMSIDPEMASQYAPMMSELTQGMLSGLAPEASKLGTTGATNYVQDALSLNFDDALAAYGGPGAYSEGAFDPVTTSNVVETPGHRRLRQAMQQGTSIDSIIARVLIEGGAPGDAFAEVNRHVQDALKAGENATADQQSLLAQLPPSDNPNAIPGDISAYDLRGVNDLAREMNDLAMSDPPEGTFSPVVGPDGTIIKPGGERRWITDDQNNEVLVEYSSQPSDVAQQYIDQGLSLPTDEYTAEGLLGQEWQDTAGALAGSSDVQEAANRQMIANKQDPALAARRSEMNEIPYGGPTTNSMRAEAPPNTGGGGGNIPNAGFNDLGIPPPEQDVSDIMQQINDEMLRFGYPGMYEDQSGLIADAAARGNDVTDIINPNNARIGGATSMPDQAGGAPGLQQLLAILGQQGGVQAAAGGGQQAGPPPDQLVANAAAQGNDVSDLNTGGYLGGFGSSRMMPTGQMLGMPGGDQPPPPTPGTVDWSQAIPGAQYNEPGAMGPPMPGGGIPPGARDRTSDFEAQRAAMFAQPDPSSGRTGPEPSEGAPINAPGVLGIGDYLAQMVLGHRPATTTAPAMVSSPRTGPEPSENVPPDLQGGWDRANAQRQALQDAIGGGAISSGLGFMPQANDANTMAGMGQQSAIQNRPPSNTSTRTGAEPSEGVRPRSNTSARTGPEPSEGAQSQLTMQMLQAILGQQPQASSQNTSTRTGGEPSEGAPRGGGSGAPGSGALWQQMWQEAQQAPQRYDPLSSANAGSIRESSNDSMPSTGRNSNRELREYNEGVGRRAGQARGRAQRNLGYRQEDVDAWKESVRQNQVERSHYGAEYGRAAGLAYLMRRAGIRPLDRELAARGAVASGMGLRPS